MPLESSSSRHQIVIYMTGFIVSMCSSRHHSVASHNKISTVMISIHITSSLQNHRKKNKFEEIFRGLQPALLQKTSIWMGWEKYCFLEFTKFGSEQPGRRPLGHKPHHNSAISDTDKTSTTNKNSNRCFFYQNSSAKLELNIFQIIL